MTEGHKTNQQKFTFEEIFTQNKRRIHYYLHKLNISDPTGEFFQEGLIALWNAYEKHQPVKGPMATYFNYTIRNRLIDRIRKETRNEAHTNNFVQEGKVQLDNGNKKRSNGDSYPLPNADDLQIQDPYLWRQVKAQLTENQWKWVNYHIGRDMPLKNIATQENTSLDAVKSWGKQVRKKFKDPDFRSKIL